MPLSPAAIGIIFNEDASQVLLIKRRDIPVWVLPGGGIDPQETAEEAVVREILEETGLKVSIQRKCAEYTPINRLGAFTSVFVCSIEQGKMSLSNETADIRFYPIKALPSLFFDIHREWLLDALKNTVLIRKPLSNVTYWKAIKYLFKHPWLLIRYIWIRMRSK